MTVVDAAGNSASFRSRTFKIDKTPPTVTCSTNPATIWPPNHQLVDVSASVVVVDALSGPAGFTLTSLRSNEADSGLDRGDQPKDIQGFTIGTADTSGQLRAERSAQGKGGRVYALAYLGRDMADNATSCDASVTVPHDRGR